MTEFNKDVYFAAATAELRAEYLTECFGDDQAAKDEAILESAVA